MQNLLQTLENVLKKDDRLVIDGVVAKNKIMELALALDASLLKLLLSDEPLKSHFFTEVEKTLIFDKQEFIRFVNNKNFLPDSYTSFKNKIGLMKEDGTYMSQSKDVVLAFPYKDCILEGGQDKEDAKRKEIFWNTTLAPDEIDRLLDPKVFTKFKRYDKNGEKEVKAGEVDFEKENLIIKGNNLLALHSLEKRYAGKVKLIYIDPPYNREDDDFRYNDKFNHSTWLTFMKNRLEVAKNILETDGVIFMHIGDDEMHYMKILCDEVFERENFIATIPRKTRSGKSDVSYKLSQDFDWMLVYTKAANKTDDVFSRKIERKYYKSEDFPDDEWRLSDLTKQTSVEERPNSNFTLINPKNGDKYPVNPNRSWAITVDTVDEYIKNKKIVFPGDYDFLSIERPAMRVFKSEEKERRGNDFDKTYVSSDFLNKATDELLSKMTNKNGTDEMVDLFGRKAFSYPKNELLLSRIIEYTTQPGDIVCDFFAGSGTTAAVALKQDRQFIICEQMDYCEDITVKRLRKVIEGEQGGISESVNWKGGGSFIYCELLKLNQSFVDEIQSAKSTKELLGIWEDMQKQGFLSYRLDAKVLDDNAEEFKKMTLVEQQRILLSVLDHNHLYVNYSEMEDKDYAVNDKDKALNTSFYAAA